MDKQISAKYYILYNDLINLNIGDFLKDRTFKIFLTKINAIDLWKSLYHKSEDERHYYSIGMDTEKVDSEAAFKKLFQYLDDETELQKLITQIIEFFIIERKVYTDFSDLKESIEFIDFDIENIKIIKEAIKKFESKEIKKQELTASNNVIKKSVSTVEQDVKKDVFIVHGHNEGIKQQVARILERQKLNPIILHEQTDEGLTIIEKLEKLSNVSFAIVLLTHDDFGNEKTSDIKNKRARQNVILELGYFFAKLERKNVLALYEKDVELPSDFSGILYTLLDTEGHWKYKMGRELKAAGFNFDLNNI